MDHIAILSHKTVLDKILNGQKTVESRFSRLKSLPYGQINEGDRVYFKLSGGAILGQALVSRVEEYDNLTPTRINELAKKYEKELALSEDFLVRKLESKFATLIFLEKVEECEPWNYKQDGRSGWIILPDGVVPVKELAADGERAGLNDFRSLGLK
jgi:ASC-1-like (ASCH) protein